LKKKKKTASGKPIKNFKMLKKEIPDWETQFPDLKEILLWKKQSAKGLTDYQFYKWTKIILIILIIVIFLSLLIIATVAGAKVAI
jgi:hypothetical protein